MIVLLYSLFALLSGLIEAVLYSRRGAEAFTRNEHAEMVLQRVMVLLLPLAGVWLYHLTASWLYLLAEHVAAVLLFPMAHDEAYNFTRLWIAWREQVHNRNPAGAWFTASDLDRAAFRYARQDYRYGYQSPTTTARNDFNGTQRTWLAIAGALLWVLSLAFLLICP